MSYENIFAVSLAWDFLFKKISKEKSVLFFLYLLLRPMGVFFAANGNKTKKKTKALLSN